MGHITTFGGNPVIAAAAKATLTELIESDLIEQTLRKEQLFRSLLVHPQIQEVRGKGLMLAPLLKDAETATRVILKCMEKGLLLFWLLFEERALRITPPLTISEEEITQGCQILLKVLDELD